LIDRHQPRSKLYHFLFDAPMRDLEESVAYIHATVGKLCVSRQGLHAQQLLV
jgi:hypothetical protein